MSTACVAIDTVYYEPVFLQEVTTLTTPYHTYVGLKMADECLMKQKRTWT